MGRNFLVDFDILSPPKVTQPLCTQKSTNRFPVAPSLCAISFSWCGKIKSSPPPCKSRVGPQYFMLIAEHSMCHPGRPGPHGLGQEGSPGLADFQSAKSSGSSLLSPTSTREPDCRSSMRFLESFPYSGNVRT